MAEVQGFSLETGMHSIFSSKTDALFQSDSSSSTRYILFFDGTGNDAKTETNIWRLKEATLRGRVGSVRQEAEYWKGVGVERWEQIRGGVFARHLSRTIRKAYCWLAERHQEGDEVHIFGFSRGAFTAMGLAGLLAWRGLPRSRISEEDLKRQFDLYHRATRASQENALPGCRSLEELDRLSDADKCGLYGQDKELLGNFRRVPIKFAGLFDTVRAAGLEVFDWYGCRTPPEVPAVPNPQAPRTLALRYTRHLPPNVERAYHALAVDEHRAVFQPRVWIIPEQRLQSPAEVEQRWFIGAHANVGGGYDGQDKLPSIPGYWIQEKAKAAGIRFDHDKEIAMPMDLHLAQSFVRDSYKEWWWGSYRRLSWREFYRPIFAWDERQRGIEYEVQTVDESVLKLILEEPGYRPRNVLTWLRRSYDQIKNGLGTSPQAALLAKCLEKRTIGSWHPELEIPG